MRAFIRNLERYEASYENQYISEDMFTEIIESQQEKGTGICAEYFECDGTGNRGNGNGTCVNNKSGRGQGNCPGTGPGSNGLGGNGTCDGSGNPNSGNNGNNNPGNGGNGNGNGGN